MGRRSLMETDMRIQRVIASPCHLNYVPSAPHVAQADVCASFPSPAQCRPQEEYPEDCLTLPQTTAASIQKRKINIVIPQPPQQEILAIESPPELPHTYPARSLIVPACETVIEEAGK
jgi:hypothetical protein